MPPEVGPLILTCTVGLGTIALGGIGLYRLSKKVDNFMAKAMIQSVVETIANYDNHPRNPIDRNNNLDKFLQLIREHRYPLTDSGVVQPVDGWEEDLLYTRRTSDPLLQSLIDQHLRSLIIASRIGVLNPRELSERELDYRKGGPSPFPPVAQYFDWSLKYVFEKMIKEAKEANELDRSQILTKLYEQQTEIFGAAGLRFDFELGETLRDMLTTCRQYIHPSERINQNRP